MAQDKHGSDAGVVLVSAMVGAAVGAVVALLLAPKPGEELRAELGQKAKEAGDKVKDAASKARDKATEMAAAAKDTIEDLKHQCCEKPAEPEDAEPPVAEA